MIVALLRLHIGFTCTDNMAISSTRSLSLSNAAEQTLSPARRLIVLVPDYDISESLLARRIWTMALSKRSEVVYVALVHDADDEARMCDGRWHCSHR